MLTTYTLPSEVIEIILAYWSPCVAVGIYSSFRPSFAHRQWEAAEVLLHQHEMFLSRCPRYESLLMTADAVYWDGNAVGNNPFVGQVIPLHPENFVGIILRTGDKYGAKVRQWVYYFLAGQYEGAGSLKGPRLWIEGCSRTALGRAQQWCRHLEIRPLPQTKLFLPPSSHIDPLPAENLIPRPLKVRLPKYSSQRDFPHDYWYSFEGYVRATRPLNGVQPSRWGKLQPSIFLRIADFWLPPLDYVHYPDLPHMQFYSPAIPILDIMARVYGVRPGEMLQSWAEYQAIPKPRRDPWEDSRYYVENDLVD